MLAELNMMLDMPVALFLVLAVGAAIGVGAEKLFTAIDREVVPIGRDEMRAKRSGAWSHPFRPHPQNLIQPRLRPISCARS